MAFEKDELIYPFADKEIDISRRYQSLINYAVRNRLQQLISEQVFVLIQNTRIGFNCDPYLVVFE